MTRKHIHIVGCLPRSGTTLMKELMVNCFEIDAHTELEHSIYKEYPFSYHVLCTKNPNDIKRISFPLRVNKNLYVIYMLRDPRDAISSRSNQHRDVWGTLRDWINHQAIADRLTKCNRFIVVRYEDLVSNPDAVQADLISRIPFLVQKAKFSDFHKIVHPSQKSIKVLGGVRPISNSSVGKWNSKLPYLKAQIEKYGDISTELIRLGYEKDAAWLELLQGVTPDNSEEIEKKLSYFTIGWRKFVTYPRRKLLYLLSNTPIVGDYISKLRHITRSKKA